MPTYEYVCTNCKNEWEEIQKISEPALDVCPKCQKSTAKRQISGGSFILKGSGWYADLYSSAKPKASAGESGSGESKKSEGKGESKGEAKPETKPETKTETKSETKAETKPSSPPTKSD